MSASSQENLTKWERGLLAYSARVLLMWAWISVLLLVAITVIAYRQMTAPPTRTASVSGTLREAVLTDRSLELWMAEREERFRVDSVHWYPGLRTRFEHGVRGGTPIELAVDAAELREPFRPPIDGVRTVSVHGMSSAGSVWLTPREVEAARRDDRKFLPYLLGFCALAALAMFVMARQRARIDERASTFGSSRAITLAASQPSLGPLLQRRAPYALHQHFVRGELGTLALTALFVLPMASFAAYFGASRLAQAHTDDTIWRTGIRASAEILATHVKENRGFVTVQVCLEAELPDGSRPLIDSEYLLLFTQPELEDRTEIRYLAGQPERAVSREAHAALPNTWWFAGTLLALGCLGFGALLSTIARTLRTLDEVRELARTGRLEYAEVVKLSRSEGRAARLTLVYRPAQAIPITQHFRFDEAPLLDQDRAVVLCSHDRRSSRALRSDGYPLAL